MAMELHVFFRGPLPTGAALSRTLKQLGFPLSLAPGPLEQQSGFVPMRLHGKATGVEFDVFDGRDNIEAIRRDLDIDARCERTASFRWCGDASEMLCALCAAAALARLTDGLVLGEDDDAPLRADEAVTAARQELAAAGTPKDRGPGTRPADIRRYLKPLLAQRSDLVLIGRRLLVRPVRHLLRGALLDRTSDKYRFRIWWYVQPLYEPPGGVGFGDCSDVATCDVWEPHFPALLMDALAEDVFARVGPMTTLGDFAGVLVGDLWRRFDSQRVRALVLDGERERAAEGVRRREQDEPRNSYWTHWAEGQRQFLARDIDAVCAEFHAREAEAVKAMKLDAIWESSPFPVELPAHERAARSAEPSFSRTPWIGTPSWLLQEMPDRPGDVRFAKSILSRRGRRLLLAPLGREEAEDRHRNDEPYCLAARLQEGVLLLLRRDGWDRADPTHAGKSWRGFASLWLDLFGSRCCANARFAEARPSEGLLRLEWIAVDERRPSRSDWCATMRSPPGNVAILDRRDPGRVVSTERALTEAERDMTACAIPEFGQFDGLLACMLGWLRHAGYGEFT